MLKRYLPQPNLTVWAACLLVAGLTLAACGGATESVSEETSTAGETEAVAPTTVAEAETEAPEEQEAAEEVAAPTATTAAEAEAPEDQEAAEEVAATDEAEAVQPEGLSTEASPVSCESVDVPDNELIAAASDDDWSKGPATASVTVVEYGDYQ